MIYWLYTSYLQGVGGLIIPLLCLTPLLIIITAASLGAGIGRGMEDDEIPRFPKIMSIITFITFNIIVITLFLALTQSLVMRAKRSSKPISPDSAVAIIAGGPETVNKGVLVQFGVYAITIAIIADFVLYRSLLRRNGVIREWVNQFRTPSNKRGSLGSAHFCTFREYRRFRRQDKNGTTFLGAFYNDKKDRLDWGRGKFCLSAEDSARGVLTLGSAGSGKTQAVILPAIADKMDAGHSLIIADPQGEITGHVLNFAKVTGHLVIVHDPTSNTGPRFNLADGIESVSDATTIAQVLIASDANSADFWLLSAKMLLGACLLRFSNLGDTLLALRDPKTLAAKLSSANDDAATLANSFIANVMGSQDAKMAGSIIATLATSLEGWADATVRDNTGVSDFDAELMMKQPTVIVLTCPGRKREQYARYLGATLRRLMLDLDTIGEQNRNPKKKGALPAPVSVILDEFPTLGRLDGLVKDVNLVRKRGISILIGAQTKGQFHQIYGPDGTQSLLTGLATQIIYGGCDPDTAKYYSEASGTTTADANPDPAKANLRQRPLLTPDEVMSPVKGNLTIFARYVETRFATQVVLNAELTRFYDRRDWKRRIEEADGKEPFMLFRPTKVKLKRPPVAAATPVNDVPSTAPAAPPQIPKKEAAQTSPAKQPVPAATNPVKTPSAQPPETAKPQPVATLTNDIDLIAVLTPVDISALPATNPAPPASNSNLDDILRSIDTSKPSLQTLNDHPLFETAGDLWQRLTAAQTKQ